MAEYGSSVATRGLLHCNSAQAPVGFRPLHKPNWLIINKKVNALESISHVTNMDADILDSTSVALFQTCTYLDGVFVLLRERNDCCIF